MNRWGIVIGSSSQEELRGQMPTGYLTTMAPCQVRQGLRELARIEENIRHRTQLTAYYQRELPRLGFAAVRASADENMPLLRYPVRVANKRELLALAAEARVEIGSWFEIPLHPEGTHMPDFGYQVGMCPRAEAACAEVVNLPTHLKVTPAIAERTLEFLAQNARPAEEPR